MNKFEILIWQLSEIHLDWNTKIIITELIIKKHEQMTKIKVKT